MRACAVEMHVNMSQEPLYTDVFTGKNAAPQNLGPNFVGACAIKMHVNISQHFTRATLYGFLNRKNAEPQNRGADFVRSCAVEMHINISQEPRKNAAPQKRDLHFFCEPRLAQRAGPASGARHFSFKFPYNVAFAFWADSWARHFCCKFPYKVALVKS